MADEMVDNTKRGERQEESIKTDSKVHEKRCTSMQNSSSLESDQQSN